MRSGYYLVIGLIIYGLTACLLGCGDKATNPPANGPFVYADTEAVHLTFQVQPNLLPDTVIYKRIITELGIIRNSYPDMSKISNFINRPAGRILVQLTSSAAIAYTNNTYHGLDSLINVYDTARSTWTPQFRQLRLYFGLPYYSDSMAIRFIQANGVEDAYAISVGGDSSRIYVEFPRYEFQLRWENCLAGCDSIHYWEYEVAGNSATLMADSGATVPDWF